MFVAAIGCLYDPDERCGENQVYSELDSLCVCAAETAPTEQGCEPCGEDEVAGPNGCDCAEGFSRPEPDAACEETPAALGVDCDAGNAPCSDARFNHCQVVEDASGYCTSTDCSSTADCEGGYACDTTASPSYCRRPPVGAGRSCSSDDDCAGTEATYCDTFMSQSCLVQGCSPSSDDCFEGSECCDLSGFGVAEPLCVPKGECQ
jgi:hypothetical protein